MEVAFKDQKEVKNAFLKLDEARYLLNKIMGPNGTMSKNERQMYLNQNMDEHDQIVTMNQKTPNNNQLTAS